jgi:[acyl-carrier-protein] S-malonyltransferase
MRTTASCSGTGSQRVGKCDLAYRFEIARRTYRSRRRARLGLRACAYGPEDDLTLTKHSQPAILVTSMAVFRVLSAEKGLTFDLAAGHSLGEWTALTATGALGFADAVRLTHARGTFMQDAVPVGSGAMAALMGMELTAVIELCKEASADGEPCEPANLNGAGQIVISGATAAIDRALAAAKGKGAKRAVKLQVSAPFHCSLMAPAAERLAAALAAVTIKAPSVPVVANVTAAPTQDPAEIKALLVEQVTAPVRWEESIRAVAAAGITRAYELGSGSVLRGLVKRIAETIDVTTIGEPHEVDAAVFGGA